MRSSLKIYPLYDVLGSNWGIGFKWLQQRQCPALSCLNNARLLPCCDKEMDPPKEVTRHLEKEATTIDIGVLTELSLHWLDSTLWKDHERLLLR
jgi:hypothetical protein